MFGGGGVCRSVPRVFMGYKTRLGSSQISPRVVLGIETSCDETGAAVLDETGTILGESLHSQKEVHLKTGGIIPPVAQRLHKENISRVVQEALDRSGVTPRELAAVATTVKPGLALSLGVGLHFSLSFVRRHEKPFIPIHHMEAHALTVRMLQQVDFPFLVLLVSGGHSLLALARGIDDFLLLGQTLDEAPGDTLDKVPLVSSCPFRIVHQGSNPTLGFKTSILQMEEYEVSIAALVARRLSLIKHPKCHGLSGGQAIELLAKEGDRLRFQFKSPMGQHYDCDFSFAGVRNQVTMAINKQERQEGVEPGQLLSCVQDIAAAAQHTVASHIAKRTHRAILFCKARSLLPQNNPTLVVSGGVASNEYIRETLRIVTEATGLQLLCPPSKFCTDNGVMIAWNGVERLKEGRGVVSHTQEVSYEPKAPLGRDISMEVRHAAIKLPALKLKIKS